MGIQAIQTSLQLKISLSSMTRILSVAEEPQRTIVAHRPAGALW